VVIFVAVRTVGYILPVGGANNPRLFSCQQLQVRVRRHHCCHGNQSRDESDFSYVTVTVNKLHRTICKCIGRLSIYDLCTGCFVLVTIFSTFRVLLQKHAVDWQQECNSTLESPHSRSHWPL